MRVVFFSKGDRSVASSRYRCYLFSEALEKNGFETAICTPPPRHFGLRIPRGGLKELLRLARELAAIRKDDLLYLQRPIYNTLFVGLLAGYKTLFRRKMIFDYCDPIFLHSPRKTRLLARLADAVIVSSEDLAVWARQHSDNVHIVPNSVRTEEIADAWREPPAGEGIVIGWVGAAKLHEKNLELLLPILARLPGRTIFRLVGARGAEALLRQLDRIDAARIDVVDWVEPDRVAAEMARMHIAVLPLVDSVRNRKLVSKLIEYLAAGLPVVASPVGDNARAIVDGENGFLATSEAEWVAKLGRLIEDRDLRRKLGERALTTMRSRYSLDASGRKLARVIRELHRAA